MKNGPPWAVRVTPPHGGDWDSSLPDQLQDATHNMISELVDAVRDNASNVKLGEWTLGRGWDLDEVSPENPV